MATESQKQNKYNILSQISSPCDVKALSENDVTLLAEQVRDFLINHVTKNGGHLASNLGVVELSIALHRVFNTPHDHIIWDVGHQSYVHKMLTGRCDMFDTLRKSGGLSGFTSRSESEHDCFGAGHSSTSLSAALGFAEADKLSGSDAYTVAVLGDGAFTGGMIHEALNNCDKDLKLIIVINENEMSISKNTGRFANSLASLRSKPGYFQTKKTTGKIIKKIPLIGKSLFAFIRGVKKSLKNLLYGSNYFEDIGLYYIGPIDGNDEGSVETVLREATKLNESVVIHLKTKKGKGYEPAEREPHLYHSLAPVGTARPDKTFSSECGRILCENALKNNDIIAITAAMSYGTGLEAFHKTYPDRFFDVGIAEEHALTFAAGLAAAGKRPIAAIYSTFLQRGFDNILHDIALQNLPVVMCIDRAGLNSGDGVTHHGIFDVAFLSGLPNVRIYTPSTYKSLELAIAEALTLNCPCAIRYPAGSENEKIKNAFEVSENAIKAVKRQLDMPEKCEIVLISHGRMVGEALKASELLCSQKMVSGVIMLERLTPYDEIATEVIKVLPSAVRHIFLLEEEIRAGGMGMLLSDALKRSGLRENIKVSIIATTEPFKRCGGNLSIHETHGVDATSVARNISNIIK